jgi:hypothetical protein
VHLQSDPVPTAILDEKISCTSKMFHWNAYVPNISVVVPHNFDADPNTTFHFDADPDPTDLLLRCEFGSDLSLWGVSRSCSISKWCKSLTTGIQILHGSILILQASTVNGQSPPWLHCLSLHSSGMLTLMWILFRLFTLMRIRIWLNQNDADLDP